MKSLRSKKIILEDEVYDGWLNIDEDIIVNISKEPLGVAIDEYTDLTIMPGLIDPHLHGFMGWNASKTDDYKQVLHMADAMLWAGVTSFVPSCISSPYLDDNIKAIHEAKQKQTSGSTILGIYMEGPFYNPKHNGGTPIKYFETPSLKRANEFIDLSQGDLLVLAMAPELENADEVIKYLRAEGIHVGIAHTDADYDTAIHAIESGCEVTTHTFNAMRSIHHREVGVIGAALLNEDVYNEINCDFIHVCPQMIEVLIRMKGTDKLLMMTDSDSLTGMPSGRYMIGNTVETLNENGKITLDDGTIYGSGKLLLDDVFNLIDELNVPIYEAVKMASLNAAKFLKVDSVIGSIKSGKKADFIIVDAAKRCIATYKNGIKACDIEDRAKLVNPEFIKCKID